ncbi:oxidoreductase-like domain-containing protein [Paenibacillus sp. CN-4]|uniref:oxidoreductase-like domain-containing protein n=1 Tax=Paenibacillus nanchangensis TaxID=3348343 RepID=UPI00397B8C8A
MSLPCRSPDKPPTAFAPIQAWQKPKFPRKCCRSACVRCLWPPFLFRHRLPADTAEFPPADPRMGPE